MALFGDGGPSATSSSDGVHRRLRGERFARGMTVEIHENAGHGASGVGHDPSMSEMLAGLTMKEVFMLGDFHSVSQVYARAMDQCSGKRGLGKR